MIQINQDNFENEVKNFKGVVVADFYADWCGPCRMLSPLMEQMSGENNDESVKFVKVNVDQNQELSGSFGVMSIPTVIFFKDGKYVGEQVGVASKDFYMKAVEQIKEKAIQ